MNGFELNISPKYFGADSQGEFEICQEFDAAREGYLQGLYDLADSIIADTLEVFDSSKEKVDKGELGCAIDSTVGDLIIAVDIAGGSTPISYDFIACDTNIDNEQQLYCDDSINSNQYVRIHKMMFEKLVNGAHVANIVASVICSLIDATITMRVATLCKYGKEEETKYIWD